MLKIATHRCIANTIGGCECIGWYLCYKEELRCVEVISSDLFDGKAEIH